MNPEIEKQLAALGDLHKRMLAEFGKVIVGQTDVLDELLITVFSGGHNLLEGVPGLAKTLMINTLARLLSLHFKRIQFTPDLMPSDIVGTNVIEEDHTTGKRVMVFVAGPIFTNVLLADEINRTPPKTQAALLQAMQEKEVTAGGKTYRLEPPFFVLATQNPIDQEGTYPLPEAQKDRFLLNTFIKYPTLADEEAIVERTTMNEVADVQPVCERDTLLNFQTLIRSIPVSKHVTGYAVDLVRATRPDQPGVPAFIKEQVGWGGGPRASQALIHCAKCHAALSGRVNVSCDDVRHLALPVLRHRLLASFAAEAEGITTDAIIGRLLETIPERKGRKMKIPNNRERSVRKPAGGSPCSPLFVLHSSLPSCPPSPGTTKVDANDLPSLSWLKTLGSQAGALFQQLHRTVAASAGPQFAQAMGGVDPQRYLDPAILAKVGFSPLLARVVVEGFLNGLHKSPFHGFSVEFAEHREYVPGDDLKYLDWALYARTDHYYIKRFEEETNLRCHLVLDHSASMAYGTGALTKWDYSCFLATCLAYLMVRQQDAVGMALFGTRTGAFVPPRCRRSHLRQLMATMVRQAPAGLTDVGASLRAAIRKLKRRGLVVLISDLIDDPTETLKAIRLLAGHRHEVIVFHVQDATELDFAFEGAALFRDMETGEEMEIDPAALREDYVLQMQELCDYYRKGLAELGVAYQLVNTKQPYDQALTTYLNRRARSRR